VRFRLAAAAFAAAATISSAPARADLAERARTLLGADQGVYVETADGTVLVAQAAARPVHPASVSKIPTTLALLRKLGPEHRFETRFVSRGAIEDGALRGDLGVEADGDPFFVDENALLVALELRKLGVSSVAGGFALHGPLLFNWEETGAGTRLRRALEGKVAPAAWQAVRTARREPGGPPPAIVFRPGAGPGTGPARTLLTHRSEPLVPLLKALNGYSNNVFGWLAGAAGGIAAVEAEARASVPAAYRDEITLGDGAGTNPRNRLSPRAAVALLRALEREAAQGGATLADLLPVAGVDPGTLQKRLAGPGERGRVAAKTGTYGDYGACALAGALRTKRGVVYFAILNHRVPIEIARGRQDAFVRALLASLDTEPWPYVRDESPAVTRASVAVGPP
jgi:D-alanyl-D-alanine carboxypeptidase/D-alanyl-D-alanine-endopeptidase (penicillin-binding protein 4)